MELPTYTSIWRIEKRLYKLYDFRLPMPLPVGQIAVFTAVTVPYIVLLTLFGLPFNHSLFWLYVLPPGLLTWLATRPVLESKRLPELLISQARYLGEPSTWCRMAPLAEKDQVVMFGRVWRRAAVAATAEAAQAEIASAEQDQAVAELPVTARPALPVATPVARPVPAQAAAADPVLARRARGRQARGRLIRQRQTPERARRRRGLRPGRHGTSRSSRPPNRGRGVGHVRRAQSRRTSAPDRPSALGRPSAADPVRALEQAGETQGTPVAGAGWAKDAAAGTWRDPGLAGPVGQGRHAAPDRPPTSAGYGVGGGARPGAPRTSGADTTGQGADGPVAGGQVIGGARRLLRCGQACQGFGNRRGCGHRLADDRLRHGCGRPAWRSGYARPVWRSGQGFTARPRLRSGP